MIPDERLLDAIERQYFVVEGEEEHEKILHRRRESKRNEHKKEDSTCSIHSISSFEGLQSYLQLFIKLLNPNKHTS